jgi:hypothetical protein
MAAKRSFHFSDKEKDEAGLPDGLPAGIVECLHSPFCRGLKVFLFSGSTPVLSVRKTAACGRP